MNENPGETPNPLNPGVGPASTPMPNQTQPMSPVQPTPPAMPINPILQSTPVAPATGPMGPTPAIPSADQTIEKAMSPETKPEKKKTGLIAGIVAVMAVLLIGGIAAAVIMMLDKTDPVTAAMNKIMTGNAPANVAIAGDIDIAINDETLPISNVKIALNSKMVASSAINNSIANVTATIRNVGDFSIEFDEVYAGNGDLYFKIDGATSALENSGILYLLSLANQMPNVVDCGEDAICQTTEIKELACKEGEKCDLAEINDTELNILDGGQNVLDADTISYFASLIDVVEVIDGEWLKVSVDELNMLSDGMAAGSDISCITNLVSNINTNSNSAAELYSKYPFISSTDENVRPASKNHPIYQIIVDSKNFANFVNSIQNSAMTTNLYSCLGWTSNVSVSSDDVAEIVDAMPKVYTEIDNDNNFTRLYLVSDLNDGEATVTTDLDFSYPTNVNVVEPEEYQNFSDVIQQIMSSMYNLPNGTGGVVIETEGAVVNTVDN